MRTKQELTSKVLKWFMRFSRLLDADMEIAGSKFTSSVISSVTTFLKCDRQALANIDELANSVSAISILSPGGLGVARKLWS